MQLPKMRLQFDGTVEDIISRNKSFASCTLKICYHGKNRNKSRVTKEVIMAALPSLYNCPIVCNYDVQTDEIGGHDVAFVKSGDALRMINKTDAIGVVPLGAKTFWETINDNGVEHEYLCTEAILWKRSAAYQKIENDGITSQSMEIDVIRGHSAEDGFYDIAEFEFTALCLLGDGIAPCFESASLETFSLDTLGSRMSEMMEDFKMEFSKVIPASADDIHSKNTLKGGESELDISELLLKYGLSAEDINFTIDGMSDTEIEDKLKGISDAKKSFADEGEPEGGGSGTEGEPEVPEEEEPEPVPADDDDDDPMPQKKYSLSAEQFYAELMDVLRTETYTDPYWGEMNRYWYVDYDAEASEVYAIDAADGKLYGMAFTMNGDNIVVDFACRKRKKTVFADFDVGEAKFGLEETYASILAAMSGKFKHLNDEVSALREFKSKQDEKDRASAENSLFARFADLNGNELFEALKASCSHLPIEQVEEKCFAIRGRIVPTKFSLEQPNKGTRLPIEPLTSTPSNEPYGGVFVKYGVGQGK